jgi:hypothetical protein
MRRKGFSFACPTQASSKDEAFQRFLKTAEEYPDKIHNPFPQTACSDNFNQACAHPLVNLWYEPVSKPEIYPRNFEQLVTVFHEETHARHNVTPAKILARVWLGRTYEYLNELLYGESWDEECWRELDRSNAELSAICSAITLSEELIAIADSFRVKSYFNSPEHLDELERLKEKSVEQYQELDPDFAELYDNTFKKVMGWCNEEPGKQVTTGSYKGHLRVEDSLTIYLGMFLQGIQLNRYEGQLGIEVVDSNGRCKMLDEVVKDMKNGVELKDWII